MPPTACAQPHAARRGSPSRDLTYATSGASSVRGAARRGVSGAVHDATRRREQRRTPFTGSKRIEMAEEATATVRVAEGLLRGRRVESRGGGTFWSFQGVPYARPPIGPLRFKFDGDVTQDYVGSEDCLYLNVFAPRSPAAGGAPLPVMVFVHGGGFEFGSGNALQYGPDYLVADGVVLVTLNYRLGVLGFLFMEEASPGNVGLKDQVAALRWVKKNIAAFGGDPGNVTLFGMSAGGASVHFHMLSPMTKGLFHRAIAMSGAALNPWAVQTDPADTTRRLARLLGCTSDDPHAIVEFLRGVDYKELVHVAHTDAVPEKEDIAKDVDANWEHNVLPELRVPPDGPRAKEALDELRRFFMGGKPLSKDTMQGFLNLHSDITFHEGIAYALQCMAKTPKAPLYLYHFSVDDKLNFLKPLKNLDYPGACHADEIGYLFRVELNDPDLPPEDPAALVRRRMIRLWTNFAKKNDPTPEDDPLLGVRWKPYTAEERNFLEIGPQLRNGTDLYADRVAFWEKFYNTYGS
ncbi:Carboxylic ester hydrolase [Gryllus bimaculatus]|nr:Carboxylic ester hydrolase [Gryllus bimaculatus]